MSNLQSESYPLDHPVFSGGRYLRAFDHLDDVDGHEHHLLVYLGSFMPFDKGFVERAAFPSVAKISRALRMSESTVRKKIRSLEAKGYVRVKAVRFINYQGKFQQSSNSYFFTQQAFAQFDDVLGSQNHIDSIRKRAVGEPYEGHSFPIAPRSPPLRDVSWPSPLPEASPPHAAAPNSSKEPNENPENRLSSCVRDLVVVRGEVERIADSWKEVVGLPVSDDEKARFLRDYVRTRGAELFFLERILELSGDVYLLSRAKSINFLFGGLDMAKRNRRELRLLASRALETSDSEAQLLEVIQQLPALVAAKSRQFADPAASLLDNLFYDLVQANRRRLSLPDSVRMPQNESELRREIDRLLKTDPPTKAKERLIFIRTTLGQMNFARSLELFSKHVPAEALNA